MYITNHTKKAYVGLSEAYDFFNRKLFNAELPSCIITLTRKKNCNGYFWAQRFNAQDNTITDEIALNPLNFANRSYTEVLSTLVHEMVHLKQQHFGKPSRNGYHNQEFANMMKEIGLITSDTGQPGGKSIGSKMTHYIDTNGLFYLACNEFLTNNELVLYSDVGTEQKKAKKDKSKVKFTCVECGANAWGKETLHIVCADCDLTMHCHSDNEDDQELAA